MKIMPCPVNGERPLQEFTFGGEYRPLPANPGAMSDAEWAAYVFNRQGAPSTRREWWYHDASGTWFIAERDTLTDTIQRTYLYEDMQTP